MLARAASELYWMSRHIERAENIARLLDFAHQLALLPYRADDRSIEEVRNEILALPLVALGQAEDYWKTHDSISSEQLVRYLAFSPYNKSSVYSCIHSARESARAMRTAITGEMYENLNSAWIRIRDYSYEEMLSRYSLNQFLDWVKLRSHQFRGITFSTMQRDDAYQFIRLGTFTERADATVRVFDMKFESPSPPSGESSGAVDYYQWSAMLQSLSAFETYRKLYRDVIAQERVVEMLVLRSELPRSLHSCVAEIHAILQQICGNDTEASVRLAGALHAELRYAEPADVLGGHLPNTLNQFMNKLYAISSRVNDRFFNPTHVAVAA